METWSSRRGFILAAIGSAVGLGNIWRFPSILGQHGGAYLLPYLVVIFAFVVPLLVLEFAVGRRLRINAVGAFRQLDQRFGVAGWLLATVVFTILSYYLVITGWTLAYFVESLMGEMTPFGEFTGGYTPIAAFLVAGIATGAVTSLGVRKGIERSSTLLMPLAFVILCVLAVYGATLSGFGEAMEFMFAPDFRAIADPRLWSAALGQALFSLSVGFGILLTYGSYLSHKTDLVDSARIITFLDIGASLLAGLVVFPVVFTIGLEPSAGAELAFVTLPAAFDQMPAGWLLAPMLFLLLFVLAITSAVSMMELNVAAVVERTGLDRRVTSIVLTVLVLCLGLPSALSYSAVDLQVAGWRILDLLDDTVGRVGLPLGALMIALYFTRRLSSQALQEEFGATGDGWSSRRLMLTMLHWPIPIALVVVVVSSILAGFDPTVLPAAKDLAAPLRLLGTAGLGAALVALTLVVVRFLRARLGEQ